VQPDTHPLRANSLATAPINGEVATAEVEDEHIKVNGVTDIRLNVFEKARTVTSVCTSGTLCTVSSHQGIEGSPFGSFVDYVLDDNGLPVLLMNDMSMHTINIERAAQEEGAPMVSLFTQLSSQTGSSGKIGLQDTSRCSLTGVVKKIRADAPDMDAIRMRYSLTHVYADQVMDSPKFSFYRLEPKMIYFVGGFGVSSKWVDVDEYKAAKADILAKDAPEIVQKINRDHPDDLMLTAKHILGLTQAQKVRATNVDRLGLDLRVTSPMGTRRNKLQTDEFRIGFRIPVVSVEDAKSEIQKVFQEAWEKGNGISWGDDELPGVDVPVMKIAADSLE
jgi:putative heme iron utilization protein